MAGESVSKQYQVLDNPERPCPPEILAKQVALNVLHVGFDGGVHFGLIEIHEDVVDDVAAFFDQAYLLSFPIDKIVPASHPDYLWDDDKLMADNATSGFNYRTIAGTDETSQHALGAFDVNPRLNPYIRYENGQEIVSPPGATWNPKVSGTLYAKHPLVVMMKKRGWIWGGDWKPESGRVDTQHFEKSRTTRSKRG